MQACRENFMNLEEVLTICYVPATELFKGSDKNDIMLMTLEIYLQHNHFIHE